MKITSRTNGARGNLSSNIRGMNNGLGKNCCKENAKVSDLSRTTHPMKQTTFLADSMRLIGDFLYFRVISSLFYSVRVIIPSWKRFKMVLRSIIYYYSSHQEDIPTASSKLDSKSDGYIKVFVTQ
jgi:hypothetical protein